MNLSNYQIPKSEEVELNEYEPLPIGWYCAQILSEEEKTTSNDGKMLKYKMQIFNHDKYKGRVVFANFNIVCSSKDAEKIARKQLAQLGKACHLTNLVDSSELLGKTCQIHVAQDEYGGKVTNKVTGFNFLDTNVAPPEAPKKEQGADVPWFMRS